MMVINNNIPALTTYGIVNNTSNQLQKSIQKLSTGLRINSAADDAAGLSISEKMRAQINGLDRAVANAQDGVSLIQTAEGALTETHSILQRMRELSVQAANDTLTQQDRSYIQEEVDLLRDEIDHIGNTTTFNTKKLLNGDAAVLWSSDNLTTKALVNGGLREVDQFGQKKSFEGNYKINIVVDPGQSEIQKTDIFKVKHLDAGTRYEIDGQANGIVTSMSGEGLTDDVTYEVSSTGKAGANVDADQLASYTKGSGSIITDGSFLDSSAVTPTAGTGTWEIAFEVASINSEEGTEGTGTAATIYEQLTANVAVTGYHTAEDGTITDINQTITIVVDNKQTPTDYSGNDEIKDAASTPVSSAIKIKDTITYADVKAMTVGDKSVWTAQAATAGTNKADMQVKFTDTTGTTQTHKFNMNEDSTNAGDTIKMGLVNLNKDTGELSYEKISLTLDDDYVAGTAGKDLGSAAITVGTVKNYAIGDVAQDNVKLRDLDKFWDSQGNFMLDDPQTITITQGNGKSAQVTLYGHDTLGDVRKKFNDAIANDLGQKAYINSTDTEGADHFVDFVNQSVGNSSESVEGTFLIRSLVPGTDGTLRFASKSEDLINAFSLNTIQNSKSSVYTVNIEDAHTGEKIVTDEKITGNKLIGKLHPNIDVEFDAMGGVTATWDDDNKKFNFDKNTDGSDTILHLADNTMTFQIGANEGDDMGIHIGDMRSHALGLDSVLVTDRDSASRSITIIDNAIDKVSTQRAKLGAYQNRLEHTMTNLSTSAENLTASESRIRDTDMAKEMMNFTKLQIMLQAGNSMLAQANQLPQNVLSLIR